MPPLVASCTHLAASLPSFPSPRFGALCTSSRAMLASSFPFVTRCGTLGRRVCAVVHVVWGSLLMAAPHRARTSRIDRPTLPHRIAETLTLPCTFLAGVFLGVARPPGSPGVNSCQHRPPVLFTRVCCVRFAHAVPPPLPRPLIPPQPPQVREAPGCCLDWATLLHRLRD